MVYNLADNIISPLGETTEQNFQALKAGRSVLREYNGYRGVREPYVASLITEEQIASLREDGLTLFESLVIASVKRTIASAGLDVTQANVVLILSSTKANIELLERFHAAESRDQACLGYAEAKKRSDEIQDNDFSDAEYPGVSAERIARAIGMSTMPITVCNACISGVSAIILAKRLLEAQVYDYAIVCGADRQTRFVISGFQSFKAVSTSECRPFDLERLGLNLGEAVAAMILARDDVAPQKSWGVASGAIRNDAYHISAPSKNGEGAYLALSAICQDRDIRQLAFINAHGTATMFNDQMESVAIERAALNEVPVNGLKGYYGHTLGAAGILETIISAKACDEGVVLGTKGFNELGVSGKIHLSNSHQICTGNSFIKMISGFGGCNAALWITKAAEQSKCGGAVNLNITHHVTLSSEQAVVDGRNIHTEGKGKQRIVDVYKRYIGDYPKFYKMDMLSRLGFVASELLLAEERFHAAESRDQACLGYAEAKKRSDEIQRFHAAESRDQACLGYAEAKKRSDGIQGYRQFEPSNDRAVILFNRSSSIHNDKLYLESIAGDEYFPSPSLFVYTLPNIVTGEIAIRNHYHGETSFYILPSRNDELMKRIIEASVADDKMESVLYGWIDFEDDDHYIADLFIMQK